MDRGMTCEICGTTANVMRVLLWQRERHDYCTSCAAQVRPIPLARQFRERVHWSDDHKANSLQPTDRR
jgi:hypothetical protein